MKKLSLGVAGVAIALAACSTPPTSPALDDARATIDAASHDPAVNTAAAADLQRARDTFAAAERAWADGHKEDSTSLAYIAKQRARIATEIGVRYSAQQQLAQTGAERDRIRSEARAREAREAEARAAAANQQAAAARAQATEAQTQAAGAQAKAEADRQRADEQAQQLQAERERNAKMQQDLQSLSAKQTGRGMVVTLQDVLFDSGKAQLRTGGIRSLERVASVLKDHPDRRVMVEGFTDSQGSESFNDDLSQRRANAVKDQLETLGIPQQRLESRGFGEAYPVADNNTAAGRQQNRRVELVFSDANGQFSAH